MSKITSLQDFLVHELQDLYHAESQIVKTLPTMIEAAAHTQLKNAFQEHLSQTENQLSRLEQAFKLLGTPAKGKKCEGMAGLIDEAERIMDEDMSPPVRDAALIAAAQKMEHYEIAAYGCVRTYAEVLGHGEVQQLLSETLAEEERADKQLTALAKDSINAEAEAAVTVSGNQRQR